MSIFVIGIAFKWVIMRVRMWSESIECKVLEKMDDNAIGQNVDMWRLLQMYKGMKLVRVGDSSYKSCF